jgi:hypothetical protein
MLLFIDTRMKQKCNLACIEKGAECAFIMGAARKASVLPVKTALQSFKITG